MHWHLFLQTSIPPYTLPMDELFNLEFQFKSVFNLEFQPKFGIQLGNPIPMGINLGECRADHNQETNLRQFCKVTENTIAFDYQIILF